MKKQITITEEEHKKLIELYGQARTTPVMLVGGVDLSNEAWINVKNYMDELGKKYGYKPQTARIDPKSNTFMAEEV